MRDHARTMRECSVCQTEMTPKFASECEPPIAWACLECGLVQLETGGRPFSEAEAAAARALMPSVTQAQGSKHPRSRAGAASARELLASFGAEPPIDVEAMAERVGFPIRWQALPSTYRGGVEGTAGHRVIVLNRNYPFQSEGERRWVIAEELGHAILEHGTLVASEEPDLPHGMREPERQAKESTAKAFAAELLMPAASVRQGFQREQSLVLQAFGTEERSHAIRSVVADLARQFGVSQRAMRIRLRELGLLT